jgi:hypothetical protein
MGDGRMTRGTGEGRSTMNPRDEFGSDERAGILQQGDFRQVRKAIGCA